MKRIHVHASREYDVLIGNGLFSRLGSLARDVLRGSRVCIVSDTNVASLYLAQAEKMLKEAGFLAESFVFPAGEGSKSGETYLALLNFLAEKQLTRADALIALGGGVTGDLTGFAAATYLRGISLIQIPTTLLACVDSSVGGKTAIDLPAGKNLAGAFYQPKKVICDPEMLETLPDSIFSEGCAEVIKYGLIGSKELMDKLAGVHAKDDLEEIIAVCVDMKRDIVESDEFDTGCRQLLNLGHTFAHSIEALSDYSISHGSAVAIGMHIITRAAVKKGLCPAECLAALENLFEKYGLPRTSPYSAEDLAARALSDKKRSGGSITIAVPKETGRSELMTIPVSELLSWAKDGTEA